MRRKLILSGAAAVAATLGIVGVLAYNDVSDDVTREDRIYADRFLTEAGYGDMISKPYATAFEGQVETVLAVQDAVLTRAPGNQPIKFDHRRSPRDLYEARSGMCYDRSRVIEQILRRLGYTVRHAAVYSTKATGSSIVSLLTPQVVSHAVTEVETARGWMLIDSNDRWIGLTHDGKTVDLADLDDDPVAATSKWDPRVRSKLNDIFRSDFVFIFGLYSRHGRFYPPYTPVPDIDWDEVVYNITG